MSIITQIGRENNISADIYMCIRRGDLWSPAGEHSSPLPCSENILMRSLATLVFFLYASASAACFFLATLMTIWSKISVNSMSPALI